MLKFLFVDREIDKTDRAKTVCPWSIDTGHKNPRTRKIGCQQQYVVSFGRKVFNTAGVVLLLY